MYKNHLYAIFDEINTDQLFNIRSLFNKYLNCKVDVGRQVMIEREPVYLYKIYENETKKYMFSLKEKDNNI